MYAAADTLSDPLLHDPECQKAFFAAKALIKQVQVFLDTIVPASLWEQAEANEWHAVLYQLHLIEATRAYCNKQPTKIHLDRMLEVAEESDDIALIAHALSSRVSHRVDDPNESVEDALAQAVTLLGTGAGLPVLVPSAYISCANSYRQRRLWPLVEEMCDRSSEALEAPVPEVFKTTFLSSKATVTYTRGGDLVAVAAEAYEAGDRETAKRLLPRFSSMSAEEEGFIPLQWVIQYRIRHDLLAAMAGQHTANRLTLEEAVEAKVNDLAIGSYYTADALRARDRGEVAGAAALAETALFYLTNEETGAPHNRGGTHRRSGNLGFRPGQDGLVTLCLLLAAGDDPAAAGAQRYGQELARQRLEVTGRDVQAAVTRRSGIAVKLANQELMAMAYTDSLTGVTNRRGCDDYLANCRKGPADEPIVVLMVDLNRFKLINDTHGHAMGDLVLRRVAEVLSHSVRDEDLTARLGGDEFLVVLRDAPPVMADQVARRITHSLEMIDWTPVQPGLEVSVSIGSASGPTGELDHLLTVADMDMYRVKNYRSGVG